MNNHQLLHKLRDGCQQLSLNVSPSVQQRILHFLEFLGKWNRSYNLSGIHDLDQMISHHVLDSLSIAPYIKGAHFLDVGTGAGFPGIPLALYFPEKHFVLLDSNGKKTRFLLQAVSEFNILNVTVVQDRIENYITKNKFDGIMTRAVATTFELLNASKHLLNDDGRWLLMRGNEVDLPATITAEIHPLHVPFLEAKRHLLIIHKRNFHG